MAKRSPEETRRKLLFAAYSEIQQHGFKAASLDMILSTAGMTKGALYHHFPNKASLVHAVVDELVGEMVRNQWVRPLQGASDPITGLKDALQRELSDKPLEELVLGSPIIKLAFEMSTEDEELRLRLDNVLTMWRGGIAASLSRGQRTGTVRSDVDVHRMSAFIVATIEGILGMAMSTQSLDQVRGNVDTLSSVLDGLRDVPNRFSTSASRAVYAR